MITGDASCGKSRIVERYVYNKFSDKSNATIGVEFITKNVVLSDGTRVRLQIWDTGKSNFMIIFLKLVLRNIVQSQLVTIEMLLVRFLFTTSRVRLPF